MKLAPRELRIVGGTHRSRKWTFPDLPGLRPTPDRVRETLFNWLSPHLAGARVLDLFAGSGALAFEALSRGAASATLVEADRTAADSLRATAARFGFGTARVEATDALAFLKGQPGGAFDLVLLDPPFDAGLVAPALALIDARALLAPGGFCYVEMPVGASLPPLPVGWQLHRSGRAGEVGYHLLHAAPRDVPRDL